MTKINYLSSMPINKLLLQYAVPSVIGFVISSLYIIINRIFIGHIPGIGSIALAAIGMTAPITTFLFSISAMIAVGGSARISILLGQRKKHEAESTAANAIMFSILLGLLIIGIYFLFHNQLFAWLGIQGQGLPYARKYIDILILGSIFNLQSFIFPNLIRADGNPKFAATITIVGCIINILLDTLFIYVLHYGIQGAALATLLSHVVIVSMGTYYFSKGNSTLQLLKQHFTLRMTILKPFLLIGMVPFFNQMSTSLAQIVSNFSFMKYGGEPFIASLSVINSITTLLLTFVNGLSQANQTIAGFNYARDHTDRAMRSLTLSVAYSTVILLSGSIIIQLFPGLLIRSFTSDISIIEIASKGLQLNSILLFLNSIFIISVGFLMVTGNAKTAVIVSISKQCILLTLIIYFLPMIIGTNGLWLAQPITDLLASLALITIIVKLYAHSFRR